MPVLKLDPVTHDLVLGEEVSGEEQIRQGVKVRLLLIRGEVLEDTDLGVPYIGEVFAKGTPPSRLAAIFRETILGTPGVLAFIEGPTLGGPGTDRTLTLDFRVSTDVGELDFSEDLTV